MTPGPNLTAFGSGLGRSFSALEVPISVSPEGKAWARTVATGFACKPNFLFGGACGSRSLFDSRAKDP